MTHDKNEVADYHYNETYGSDGVKERRRRRSSAIRSVTLFYKFRDFSQDSNGKDKFY